MKGFPGFGLLALLLALAGAAGLGPPGGAAGEAAVAVVDLSPSSEPPAELPAGALIRRDSRLGAALREAARRGARRIRLFTDGCDRSGAAPEVPPVPVDVVLRPRRDDVGILGLRAPARIPVGTPFAVEIVLGRTEGPDRPPVAVRVALQRDGRSVGPARRIRLRRGQRRRLLVRDRVDREGLVRYRAHLRAAAGDPGNDTREAVAHIGARPFVLAVGGRALAGPFGTREVDPAELASRLADPEIRSRLDAVYLRGPLRDLRAQELLAETVRGGTGLLLVGGGGFAGGPLDPVLPLTDAPPQGRAALLLLDFSGSMQELKEELLDAVERLKTQFAPGDLMAFIAFRDQPVASSPWQEVREARWEQLRSLEPHGNTRLEPALRAARKLLAGAGRRERRLFVVSDGKWGDRSDPQLERSLRAMGGIHRAALFVADEVPAESRALFPVSLQASGDLAAALRRLEDAAADRTVKRAVAQLGTVPSWLEGALPASGTYEDFIRLYPRNAGESEALRGKESGVPLVGAWRPAGKVVRVAPVALDAAPLLLSVLRDSGGVALTARREGAGLVVEASGGEGEPFLVDGAPWPARAAGPGLWRATIPRVSAASVEVACGRARLVVPPAAARELAGLRNCSGIAAAIARASGGRLYREAPPAGGAARGTAVHVTLLAAAVLVLLGAVARRRRG